jgi:diguanylate cyclase (GGDEF)-like protein
VLDLDNLKAVNDRFGHQTGDEVLMRVAALLLGALRGKDVVVRTVGEEFVLLMPQTRREGGRERMRALPNAIARSHGPDRHRHDAHGPASASPPP